MGFELDHEQLIPGQPTGLRIKVVGVATQLQGTNVIILVAGMGKGSGTGLAPGIALVAA